MKADQEMVFNLFLFINDGVIREIGVLSYEISGDDESKLHFLQNKVLDWKHSRRRELPHSCILVQPGKQNQHRAITYATFVKLGEIGMQMLLLEETIFKHYPDCRRDPLMVITAIVDGEIRIDGFVNIGEPNA